MDKGQQFPGESETPLEGEIAPELGADHLPSPEELAWPADAQLPVEAGSIYEREIPPDNEHGDGVRNPPPRPCAGIKGNGLLTPKIYNAAEDWRDYNYSDFNY